MNGHDTLLETQKHTRTHAQQGHTTTTTTAATKRQKKKIKDKSVNSCISWLPFQDRACKEKCAI